MLRRKRWMLGTRRDDGPAVYDHQGSRPVRKSVSVQGEKKTTSSLTSAWARASDRGAGPRTTLPAES